MRGRRQRLFESRPMIRVDMFEGSKMDSKLGVWFMNSRVLGKVTRLLKIPDETYSTTYFYHK